MDEIQQKLSNLSPEQRQLFEILLKKENSVPAKPPVLKRNYADKAPLSYAQQGLWIAARTESTSPFHHPLAFRISGQLDYKKLEQSLAFLIERHEILRTTYKVENGEVVQIINKAEYFSLPIIDLQNLTQEQKEKETHNIVLNEGLRPFDLENGPMLRVKLVKWQNDENILIIVSNSFITDGFSFGLLLNELGSCYNSYINNELPKLPPLKVQFSDFAIWQRQLIDGGFLNEHFEYWKQHLKDCPTHLKWPVDGIESVSQTFEGGTKSFSLTTLQSVSLRQLARKEGVTLFMIFLTAVKLIIYKITEQEDFVIGTLASNRNTAELESALGYFGNNIILRIKTKPDQTFRQVLKDFNELTLEGFAHQEYPFEKLLEESSKEGAELTIPQLQVMFVLHDHAADEDLFLSNVNLTNYPTNKQTSIFDLYFRVTDSKNEIFGSIEYNKDKFNDTVTEQIISHFKILLESIISNIDTKLSDLNFLNESQRNEMITDWTDHIKRRNEMQIKNTYEQNSKTANTLFIRPESELEKTIASVWQKVFKLDKIGVNDNFFDLGGKSLQLMEVHNRLQSLVEKKFTIVDLFEYPTIIALAKYLSKDQVDSGELKSSFERAQMRRESRTFRKRS